MRLAAPVEGASAAEREDARVDLAPNLPSDPHAFGTNAKIARGGPQEDLAQRVERHSADLPALQTGIDLGAVELALGVGAQDLARVKRKETRQPAASFEQNLERVTVEP